MYDYLTPRAWKGRKLETHHAQEFFRFTVQGTGYSVRRSNKECASRSLFPSQDGTEENDLLLQAAMVDGDMSFVAVGGTEGSFGGSASGDLDGFVAKFDTASGAEIWRYQVWVGRY